MRILNVIQLIIIFTYFHSAYVQIARDISLKFLLLDNDGDHLLSSSELIGQKTKQNIFDQKFYFCSKFEASIYPHTLWKKYDTDLDGKLSLLQLHKIVSVKMKRHMYAWPKNRQNILNNIETQDYFLLCDTNQSKGIEQQQFVVCIRAFLIYEFHQYPYKVKSKLYPNKTIGYDLQDFKKMWPKSDGTQQAEMQLKKLFDRFEWAQTKIPQDTDLLIGPEQGKFLQPTILYFYLDANKDEVLDKEEAMRYLPKHGGEEAFRIADFTGDEKLDQAELTAYFLFVLCIEDCDDQQTSVKQCQRDNNSEQNLLGGFRAVCDVLQNLNRCFEEKKWKESGKNGEGKNIQYHSWQKNNKHSYGQL